MVFSGFSKFNIFKPSFGSMTFSCFGSFSIDNFSIAESGSISFSHFSKMGVPLICNKFMFWCAKSSFSRADM